MLGIPSGFPLALGHGLDRPHSQCQPWAAETVLPAFEPHLAADLHLSEKALHLNLHKSWCQVCYGFQACNGTQAWRVLMSKSWIAVSLCSLLHSVLGLKD